MTLHVRRSHPALTAAALVVVSGLFALSAPTVAHAADAKPADSAKTATEKKLTTFGVQPATATTPDARPAFTYGVTPGASLRDHVALLNYSTKPLTLVVYPADGLNTDTGGFSLQPQSSKPVDAGAWVKLGGHARTNGAGARTVTVPARGKNPGRVILPITVAVPATAAAGDHVGGIVASLPTSTTKEDGANLRLDQRVASRVYIRVSGALVPKLTIGDVHASYHAGSHAGASGGSATVTYVVRNEGNAKLGSRQRVVISGLFGGRKATVQSDVPLLLPGASLEMRAEIADVLPRVRYSATVNVQPVSVGGDVDPGLAPVSASTHFWAVPWLLLGLVLGLVLVLLLALGGWLFQGRRSSRPGSGSHSNRAAAKNTSGTKSPSTKSSSTNADQEVSVS